ncbi:MAG TPA: cytidine deaminase [Streptomyces sp.]|nr:cytidine deaminase [Streptomyces sp.]
MTSDPVDSTDVDWAALRASARDVMTRAYAPYSGFPVGAAALADDGRTVTGCNVENAAFGVALCAECGLISSLIASGGGRLTAFTCVDRHGEVLMPCGRCRQLLWEHGGPELLMETKHGSIRTLADLLPDAFGPSDLKR